MGSRWASAFTLVELLVVIGIVGLLISILMPALAYARRSAQTARCLSNLRQINIAGLAYAAEHGRLMPYSQFARGEMSMSGLPIGVNVRWCWSDDTPGDPMQAFKNGLIAPYLSKVASIAGCPSYETPQSMIDSYTAVGLAYPAAVHYGYNGLLLGEKHASFLSTNPTAVGYRSWVGYRPATIRRSAETAVFADTAQLMSGRVLPNHTISPPISVNFDNGTPRAIATASVHGRHGRDRANVAWLDGHCTTESVRYYADQPAAERNAKLGYLAPDLNGERSNRWVFVK